MVYLLKMVIFHGYVKKTENNNNRQRLRTNGRGQASEPQVSVKSQTLKHVGKIDGQRLGNLQDYIQICAKKW